MASGPSPENVAAIDYLRSQGYSDRRIERELGIGGSGRLIGHAHRAKPARNLTGPLNALAAQVRGERAAPPPPVQRRQTSAGGTARVRRGIVTTQSGARQLAVASANAATLRRFITDAADAGALLKATVTWKGVRQYSPPLWFRPGQVSLWDHGGWDAYAVMGRLYRGGRGTQVERWARLCLRKPGVEGIEKPLLSIEVTWL